MVVSRFFQEIDSMSPLEPLPPQGQHYSGSITDTSRWQNFQHRGDDIFICTPPKCGTTWTQAICAMLIFGTAEHGKQVSKLSPWVDATFAPIDEYLEKIDQQPHRRFIKTHTPFDGIPYYPECTYLVILRDPRDAFLSGLGHGANLNDRELAANTFPTGPNAFEDWLRSEKNLLQWDLQCLASLVHFFHSYWRFRDLSNVHVFHYADMKNDLAASIASMASALGVSYDDDQIAEFVEAASFANMKANAQQFAPEAGTGLWKAETDFFANGGNRQWQGRLSEDEVSAFTHRIKEMLGSDEVEWFLNGNGRQ
jgi:aryl sulfotransferase